MDSEDIEVNLSPSCGTRSTFYSWSKKGKGTLLRRHDPQDIRKHPMYRCRQRKIKDMFKFYLKRCLASPKSGMSQDHIQLICDQLKNQDEVRFAVRLELALPDGSEFKTRAKYLAIIVKNAGSESSTMKKQHAVIGFDISENRATSIGLRFPVVNGVKLSFYGDGKFMIYSPSDNFSYVFRPVSVQAMWYCFQALEKCLANGEVSSPVGSAGGIFQFEYEKDAFDWVNGYSVTSNEIMVTEWKTFPDKEFEHTLASSPIARAIVADELTETEEQILSALRKVLPTCDLEDMTSKALRDAVQRQIGTESNIQLSQFKSTFDKLMMFACNQAEAPSKIFDHVYLGNEGNATNKEEMKSLGITHILNVSNEIDNLYPHDFVYQKIQVNDEPSVDLMRHWQNSTNRFIHSAKKDRGKVLVHCKMGKSRSAATVIAYAMKSEGWSDSEAFEFVKAKRPVICPNEGFTEQLRLYSGILAAKRHKRNPLWSESSLDGEDGSTDDNSNSASNAKNTKELLRAKRSLELQEEIQSHNVVPVRKTKELFESGIFDFCFQLPRNNKDPSLDQDEINSGLREASINDKGSNSAEAVPSAKAKRPLAFRNSNSVRYWDKTAKVINEEENEDSDVEEKDEGSLDKNQA